MPTRRALLLALGAAALPSAAKVGQVELGVCGLLDDFAKAEQYGFDYLEPSAAALSALSPAAFAEIEKRVSQSRLRCECFNSFIRSLVVVGPSVDRNALTEYMKSTLDRCQALGATIVVWGSAGSRNVPDGYSRDQAWQQIGSFLRLAGDIAQPRKITIAIEPLRKQESNIINNGAEAFRLVREVDHPNVRMIIDYYHLREESEDPAILEHARDAIVHLHFANPNGRVWPKSAGEDPLYGRFFELVKKTNFRGGLSIEGKGTFDADGSAALGFFRKQLT